MKSAIIFVLISVLTVALGVIGLLLWKDSAIAVAILTSVVAGGAANLGYTLIRFVDDTYGTTRDRRTDLLISDVSGNVGRLLQSTIVTEDPSLRCIFDKQLTQVVDSLVVQQPTAKIEIDVIGYTLFRFYSDQFEKLCQRGGVSLRAIIQDPTHPNFDQVADQEGRKLETSIVEAVEFTSAVTNKAESVRNRKPKTAATTASVKISGTKNRDSSHIELRWIEISPSITMIRINDIVFVRPRFLLEGRDAPVFFEKYYRSHGRCYQAYAEYFKHAWDQAQCPSTERVATAKARSNS